MNKTIDQVQQIVTKINEGQGTIGLIVNDSKLYKQTTETVTAAHKILDDLEQGKGALGTMTKDPKFKAQLEKTMGHLETTSDNASKSSADLKEATGAAAGDFQKSWMIS